ncbi:hypothetical protein Tco_1115874 [Tanacetum coccineum]
MAGANLRTITASPRFVISSDSSHHSGANIAKGEVNSFARPSILLMTVATTVTSTVNPATTVKEKFVESSVLQCPDVDLQKVYVPQWSVINGSRLDDGCTCREIVDKFAPPMFFASIHGMDHDQLFTEFNVGAARQMSLSVEVRMRAKYNIRERRRLNSVEAEAAEANHLHTEVSKFEVVEKSLRDEVNVLKEQNVALEQESIDLGVKVADLAASVKVREQEVADLDAQVIFAKSQSGNLTGRVHELETSSAGLQEKVTAYENCMGKLEEFQDEQIRVMNDKFEKLYAIRLHTEVSKFEVVEKSLRDEVNVLKEQNVALEQESVDLGVKVADLAASVKVREQEVAELDAQVHELETSSAGLQEKVTAYENCMGKLEEFQDE